MKPLRLTAVIFVFLLFVYNGVQGQTPQPQIDPLKLMQQYAGTWQLTLNKDTAEVIESQLNGNIMIDHVYLVVKGTKLLSHVNLYCYSPAEKKFNGFTAIQNGTYGTFTLSFESDNQSVVNVMQNFNPDQPVMKLEILYESPTIMIIKHFDATGAKLSENRWTKIKY